MTHETDSNTIDQTVADTSREPSVWPFVVPFAAYMLIASRSPALSAESIDDAGVERYFYLIIVQVAVAGLMIAIFAKAWLRAFPFRIDIWGFIIGAVGVVLWVGICSLNLERQLLDLVGLGNWLPERVGFNPFDQITDPARRAVFLIFRFTLLAAMVPVIEEVFLRGWLLRYVEDPAWYTVKLAEVGTRGVVAVAIYAVATHPGEAVAAIVWFTLVSMLMIRTGRFWNCVIAHAVTNLLLGIYVVYSGQWHLW